MNFTILFIAIIFTSTVGYILYNFKKMLDAEEDKYNHVHQTLMKQSFLLTELMYEMKEQLTRVEEQTKKKPRKKPKK